MRHVHTYARTDTVLYSFRYVGQRFRRIMNVMDFDPCSPESTADESHEVSWQGEKFLAEPGADFHHYQCKIWWRKLWSFNLRHFDAPRLNKL